MYAHLLIPGISPGFTVVKLQSAIIAVLFLVLPNTGIIEWFLFHDTEPRKLPHAVKYNYLHSGDFLFEPLAPDYLTHFVRLSSPLLCTKGWILHHTLGDKSFNKILLNSVAVKTSKTNASFHILTHSLFTSHSTTRGWIIRATGNAAIKQKSHNKCKYSAVFILENPMRGEMDANEESPPTSSWQFSCRSANSACNLLGGTNENGAGTTSGFPVTITVLHLVIFRFPTNEVLHMEHSIVRCWNVDASERRSEIPGKF